MEKIIFGVLLSLALSMGINCFAYTDIKNTETLNLLNELGIMQGYEDGTFRPNNTLTRSEAVKMIVTMASYGDEAEQIAADKEFREQFENLPYSDITKEAWDWGYWHYATELGVINGFGDGTIRPHEAVTYEQFVKILICAMGYTSLAEDLGGYPKGYTEYGKILKITSDMKFEGQTPINRLDAAEILVRALEIPIRVVDGFGENGIEYVILDGNGNKKITLLDVYNRNK